MLAVFGQAAIKAAEPAAGERVLDVGRGAGTSSLVLAARVGTAGHVLGVYISEPLIDRARELAPKDTPALFRVADAGSAEWGAIRRGDAGDQRAHALGLLCRRGGRDGWVFPSVSALAANSVETHEQDATAGTIAAAQGCSGRF